MEQAIPTKDATIQKKGVQSSTTLIKEGGESGEVTQSESRTITEKRVRKKEMGGGLKNTALVVSRENQTSQTGGSSQIRKVTPKKKKKKKP